MTGVWPNTQIDHKDLNGLNNRWENLRLASNTQNLANRKAQKNNRAGIKGVRQLKSGRYKARIQVDGKSINLGNHETASEAASAYKSAAKKYYGEYSRIN